MLIAGCAPSTQAPAPSSEMAAPDGEAKSPSPAGRAEPSEFLSPALFERVRKATPASRSEPEPALEPRVAEQVSTQPTRLGEPAAAPPTSNEPQGQPPSTAELVARLEPSVAVVASDHSHGTGFLVAPGLLVTNAHVVDESIEESIRVRFPSAPEGRRGPHEVRLLEILADRDLAFLEVPTDLAPLALANDYAFRKGEEVLVIGSPGIGPQVVLENAITRGLLSSQLELEGQHFFQLDASVNPGNSGGPVFDARGRVLGVVTLKANQQEALAFCIPVKDLWVAIDALGPPGPDGKRGSSNPLGSRLRYRLAPDEVLVYDIQVVEGENDGQISRLATSVYRGLRGESGQVLLEHRGVLVERRGGANASASRADIPPSRVAIDARGRVLESGDHASLPFLGDLSVLPFDPLPIGTESAWRVENDLVLRLSTTSYAPTLPDPRLSPFRRFGPTFPRGPGMIPRFAMPPLTPELEPRVTVREYPAHEVTEYRIVGSRSTSKTVTILRSHRLETNEKAEADRPLLAFAGQGEIQFDRELGHPVSARFDGKVTEIRDSIIRIPIRYRARLLGGADRRDALALVDPPARVPGRPAAPGTATPGSAPDRTEPDRSRPPVLDGHWTVLFRGQDPTVWNTVSEPPNYAVPVANAPRDTRYVRLKRLDTGATLIMAVARDDMRGQVSASADPRRPFRWNGMASAEWGAIHLGIAEGPLLLGGDPASRGPVFVQTEAFDGFVGSGFGHEGYGDGSSQHFGWRGAKIDPTDFEIAVTAGPLTDEEKASLLNPAPARRRR